MKGRAARASDQVERWAALYTRGLPPEIADARQAEMASDLYEQLTYFAHRGIRDRDIARAVRYRALRGIGADLVWRRQQLRDARRASNAIGSGGWLPASLLVLCGVLGGGELLGIVLVLIRWSARASKAPYISGSSDLYIVIAGMALCMCGLWLLRRARSRWLGTLWLAASVYPLVERGFAILVPVSASARFVQDLLPSWSAIEWSVIVGITLIFVGAAIWWAPASQPAKSGISVR